MLVYLYTNTLPAASTVILLEDIVTADRYGITTMLELCTNMIVVDENNWFDVLIIADMLNIKSLLISTKTYVSENFYLLTNLSLDNTGNAVDTELSDINEDMHQSHQKLERFQLIQTKFPTLFDDVLSIRQLKHIQPPSVIFMNHFNESIKKSQEVKRKKSLTSPMSATVMFGLALMFVSLLGYQSISNVVSYGIVVPVINVAFVIGSIYIMLTRFNKSRN